MDFIDCVGVSKATVWLISVFGALYREDLNTKAERRIAVLHGEGYHRYYPEDKTEYFDFPIIPPTPIPGPVPFLTKEIYIDADDFAEVPR